MMRDVMAGAGLTIFAEIGLVIFFAVFVGAVVHLMRRPKEFYERVARMPLEDEDGVLAHDAGDGLEDGRRSGT